MAPMVEKSASQVIERYIRAKESILKAVKPDSSYLVFIDNKFEGLRKGSEVIADLDKNRARYFDKEQTLLQLVPTENPLGWTV